MSSDNHIVVYCQESEKIYGSVSGEIMQLVLKNNLPFASAVIGYKESEIESADRYRIADLYLYNESSNRT